MSERDGIPSVCYKYGLYPCKNQPTTCPPSSCVLDVGRLATAAWIPWRDRLITDLPLCSLHHQRTLKDCLSCCRVPSPLPPPPLKSSSESQALGAVGRREGPHYTYFPFPLRVERVKESSETKSPRAPFHYVLQFKAFQQKERVQERNGD